MSIDAMKKALEALEGLAHDSTGKTGTQMMRDMDNAITALRAAIAEAEKVEPDNFRERLMENARLSNELGYFLPQPAERQEPVAEVTCFGHDADIHPMITYNARLMCNFEAGNYPLYTTPQPAIPAGMVLVPVEPTEEEIDAPRYLLQALELGIKNIQDIRKHLERCGVDISCTPEWFRNDSGHLTKAGKAIVVRSLMLAAAPKPENEHD